MTEFGLTLGLTAAGMPEEAALAAVVLYRVSTFYLPPVWRFVIDALAAAQRAPLTGAGPAAGPA